MPLRSGKCLRTPVACRRARASGPDAAGLTTSAEDIWLLHAPRRLAGTMLTEPARGLLRTGRQQRRVLREAASEHVVAAGGKTAAGRPAERAGDQAPDHPEGFRLGH